MEKPLTAKQLRFCSEYLIDLDGTKAAIRAGFSKKTAAQQASRMLRIVKVREAIKKAMDERSERTGLDADYVLTGIKDTVERCRQVKVVTHKGKPVLVKTDNGELKALCTFDAFNVLRGYELLGKHLKLFTDKMEITGLEQLAERIAKARQRAS